jgi:hypothetical protein
MKFRLLLFVLVLLLCAGAASAQNFGVHAGYYSSDLKQWFVGADAMFPFGPVAFSPNVDYSRKNGIGYWFGSADLDLHYNVSGGPEYWFGAGPTYGYFTGYNTGIYSSSSTHQWGWDVNGGLGFSSGPGTRPYVSARYIKIKDFKTIGGAVGLRF